MVIQTWKLYQRIRMTSVGLPSGLQPRTSEVSVGAKIARHINDKEYSKNTQYYCTVNERDLRGCREV